MDLNKQYTQQSPEMGTSISITNMVNYENKNWDKTVYIYLLVNYLPVMSTVSA